MWDWATMPLASNRKILPSPVRATERVDRVNRETPSSFSRERIWWDTVGWVTWSCSAARAKFRWLATARKTFQLKEIHRAHPLGLIRFLYQ